jgi:hypothetical protein
MLKERYERILKTAYEKLIANWFLRAEKSANANLIFSSVVGLVAGSIVCTPISVKNLFPNNL